MFLFLFLVVSTSFLSCFSRQEQPYLRLTVLARTYHTHRQEATPLTLHGILEVF